MEMLQIFVPACLTNPRFCLGIAQLQTWLPTVLTSSAMSHVEHTGQTYCLCIPHTIHVITQVRVLALGAGSALARLGGAVAPFIPFTVSNNHCMGYDIGYDIGHYNYVTRLLWIFT